MRYSKIQYLCWLFSGAEISLLKECPTDFNRQASIGFTILMTCLFAGMAGGFAAWRFSEGSAVAAGVFGLVWALLIFSIDRSMVVTLKKDPTKQTSRWGLLVAFLARMILAGLLAFLISIPLEVQVFHVQIDNELSRQNTVSEDSLRKELARIYGRPAREAEKRKLDKELADAKTDGTYYDPPTMNFKAASFNVRRLESDINGLVRDIGINERDAGNAFRAVPKLPIYSYPDGVQTWVGSKPNKQSNAWRKYRTNSDDAAKNRKSKKLKSADLEVARTNREKIRQDFIKNNGALIVKLNFDTQKKSIAVDSAIAQIDRRIGTELPKRVRGGFVREFTALGDASIKDRDLWLMLWLIRAMFFVIELLPTIVKLATPLGEYDRQLHAHERMFALALDTNYKILEQREQLRQQTELEISQQLEQIRQEKEIELGKNVLEQTATIQNDLATRMLKEWQKQERDKMKPPAGPKPAAGPPASGSNGVGSNGAASPSATPPFTAGPVPQGPPPSPPTSGSSITLAALIKRWGLEPDATRQWYQFENGSTNNKVRRYIGQSLETGTWQHPQDDTTRLRISFDNDEQEYTVQRLTNTEMLLENAATNTVTTFTC